MIFVVETLSLLIFLVETNCDKHLLIDPNVEENWGDVESHCLDLLKWKKCVDPVWNWTKGKKMRKKDGLMKRKWVFEYDRY